MGRGSYLGGSTLLYAGKSWSSNDDIETPAVAWGRHLRHLESLAKAELEQRRKALLALLVPIVDHASALGIVAYSISNPRSPEEQERHRDVAEKLAVDTSSMMKKFLDAVAEFESPGPSAMRSANLIANMLHFFDCMIETDESFSCEIYWRHVRDSIRRLDEIQHPKRKEGDILLARISLLNHYGFHSLSEGG
jgi:hypothetical protein